MRVSRNWLSDYVDFDDLSYEGFSDLITTRVAEVDGIEKVASPVDVAMLVLIKSAKPHPEKPGLKVLTVATGKEELQVVCGAPNVTVGALAVYLPPGAEFYAKAEAGLSKVEVRDIAGVQSNGVLVSEMELGLGSDHAGIMLFSAETSNLKPGTKLLTVTGGSDTVIELDNKSLTHRPDLWSHYGFAREIAAVLRRPLKNVADRFADDSPAGAELWANLGAGSGKARFGVEIGKETKVRRFTGLEIEGVSAMPSPLWMRRRLFAVGAGVRNLLIDLSNYVMFDIGQPNHAYDADGLQGTKLFVRNASSDELFVGLDGIERKLTVEDVVIADTMGPVSLGGIIGGNRSSILDTTKRLFLESANFDPVGIRQTAKRYSIRTDASNRFEKSQSPFAPPLAIQRFTELLLAAQPNARVHGGVVDSFPGKPAPISVSTRYGYIRERLGKELPDNEISGILTALGFGLSENKGELQVNVPYYRATRDISIPDDLVEEVGRVYGYENIPECSPLIESSASRTIPIKAFENRVRDMLAGAGFSESYNYSFMDGGLAERLGYSTKEAVSLLNPIDSNQDLMRTTLVPGMLDFIGRNVRYTERVNLFELGRSYEQRESAAHNALKLRVPTKDAPSLERRLLVLGYVSGVSEELLQSLQSPALSSGGDFYALAAVVRRVCKLVSHKPVVLSPLTNASSASASADFSVSKSWMHPFRMASISVNGVQLGIIAEVSPGVIQDCNSRAVVAELDLELLLECDPGVELFKHLPKYPDSFFEMSVVMPEKDTYEKLHRLILKNIDNALLRRIEVLAVYQGKPLKSEEKSVSVKLYLGSDEGTLSGEALTVIQDRLMSAVESSSYALRR